MIDSKILRYCWNFLWKAKTYKTNAEKAVSLCMRLVAENKDSFLGHIRHKESNNNRLTSWADWAECLGALIWEKQRKNQKNVYNNSKFAMAFSVILQPRPPRNNFLPGKPLQIFLENYLDILRSIGKDVEKF